MKENYLEKKKELKDHLMSFEEYVEKQPSLPYVFDLEKGDKHLVYFGARHTNNPEDSMYIDIRKKYEELKPELVLIEGWEHILQSKEKIKNDFLKFSEEEIITQNGEPAFSVRLAVESGADFDSPEISTEETIKNLSERFSPEEILTYYVTRMANQYDRNSQDFNLEKQIESDKNRLGFEDVNFSRDDFLNTYKKITGKDFSLNELEDDIDPMPWKGKALHDLNRIARATGEMRDGHMVDRVSEYIKKYNKIFIVFGGSHAVVQEPALKKVFENL